MNIYSEQRIAIYFSMEFLIGRIVLDALTNAGYTFISAEQSKIPANYVELTDEDAIKNMEKLLDMLDDNDDVTNVWHNWDE